MVESRCRQVRMTERWRVRPCGCTGTRARYACPARRNDTHSVAGPQCSNATGYAQWPFARARARRKMAVGLRQDCGKSRVEGTKER